MKTALSFLCVLGICWCLWSCERAQSYSEIPEIRFKSLIFDSVYTALEVFEKKAFLTFSFIDGDGDIGVRSFDYDSVSKIHYIWHKKLPDKTYEPFQFPLTGTIADSTAIPYNSVMNKDEAQNKTLKGSIEIALDAPQRPQDVDTMRIEFYIFDRERNKSNVDYTPDFSILNTSNIEEKKE